jgi:nitrate/nitrite-specific signal transduction histidine kinase
MLRRKLLLILGSLVTLLLATVVGAIWMLQSILGELRHINTEAWAVIQESNELATTISAVEIELYELATGRKRHLDSLIDSVTAMQESMKVVEKSYVVNLADNVPILDSIRTRLPAFVEHVGALATAQDPDWAKQHHHEALNQAVGLRHDIMVLSRNVRQHGEQEHNALTTRFRWMLLTLTVVFLVVINISIFVLLRMAAMIVRPMDKLVEATRQLGQERFDYRVELDQKDEFDQLARAYNSLAGQLQANEQRKLEMMGQVALTLNHELNNAIAIIELQLQLLSRQTSGNARVEKCAREIHESLARMTRTVDSLKRVRKIVLTDYIAGVKMLDLARSVEDIGTEPTVPQTPQQTSAL